MVSLASELINAGAAEKQRVMTASMGAISSIMLFSLAVLIFTAVLVLSIRTIAAVDDTGSSSTTKS